MKLLFFGSDEFAIASLQALVESQHKILAVVTQPDKPAGRGRNITSCPTALVTKALKLKLLQPAKIQEEPIIQELLALKPDILVVVAYGKFLPQTLIDAVPFQAVNIHPSLLPKYRGASPIQWAVLNGDARTGVTTLKVCNEMDAGDIYLQCETVIDEVETAEALGQRLSILGANLLLETLEQLEKNKIKAKPQDPKRVVMTRKLTKEDGHLWWQEKALTLYNQVRALNPWPGTFCRFNGKILKIFDVAVVKRNAGPAPGEVLDNKEGLIVACGQEALCLLEVQLEGKKRMSISDFLKGYNIPTGTVLK